MSTPEIHLATAFVDAGDHRIVTTREPNPSLSVRFVLVRGGAKVDWAVRADVAAEIATELDALAAEELPHGGDWTTPPKHDERYRELLSTDDCEFDGGPLFTFPDELAAPTDIIEVKAERDLADNFHGWVHGEISGGRAPVMALAEGGVPVSICFSARRSNTAAEAGVDTAERFRRRGYAARVTAAWALALRARRVTPLYSTSWSNAASLGVANKLGLVTYGSRWTAS